MDATGQTTIGGIIPLSRQTASSYHTTAPAALCDQLINHNTYRSEPIDPASLALFARLRRGADRGFFVMEAHPSGVSAHSQRGCPRGIRDP